MTTTESPAPLIEELFCKGHPLEHVLNVGRDVGWSHEDVMAVLRDRQWDLDASGRLPRSKRMTAPPGLRAARPPAPAAPQAPVRRLVAAPAPRPAIVEGPSIDEWPGLDSLDADQRADYETRAVPARPSAAVFSAIADWAEDPQPEEGPSAADEEPSEPAASPASKAPPAAATPRPRRAPAAAPDTDAAVARFLAERTVPAPDEQFLTSPELRDAYEAWRGEADAPAVTTRQFGTALTGRYRKKQSPTVIAGAKPMCYFGLAWKPAESQERTEEPSQVDGPPSAEEIRAKVDAMAPRTHEDGSINTSHVAMEETLRDRHGHPSYIAELDGPGKFRPAATAPTNSATPDLLAVGREHPNRGVRAAAAAVERAVDALCAALKRVS